ncbi:MAG: folate family ECF transporter S component [Lachnospiraceae bacterium]|nr:folate family ECF transporter S component [Lachnospiraceae bacterium]
MDKKEGKRQYRFLKLFGDSVKEFTHLENILILAMITALYVVLKVFAANLDISSRVSFTIMATTVAGMLFGPIPAMLVGTIGDILGFFMKPSGTFFPGFTLTEAIKGLVCGIMLYKMRKPYFFRIEAVKSEDGNMSERKMPRFDYIFLIRVIVMMVIVAVINVLLNTYWLHILYGKAYTVYLAKRITENSIQLPANIILAYFLLIGLYKANIHRFKK